MSNENKPTKQVIVIRTKYPSKDGKTQGIRSGKLMAQSNHAALSFITRKLKHTRIVQIGNGLNQPTSHYAQYEIDLSMAEHEWLNSSFRKITLCVDSEGELVALHEKALAAGLQSHLITDNGLTEFAGIPTKTALAIGPDYDFLIDPITKDLKLY